MAELELEKIGPSVPPETAEWLRRESAIVRGDTQGWVIHRLVRAEIERRGACSICGDDEAAQ